MIKDIFIPERLGNYYIFPERIVGVDTTKSNLFTSQVYLYGKKITIEKNITRVLETGNGSQERTVNGIQALFSELPAKPTVHIALPNSLAIFKTLKLPFTSYEKIKMVIGYELEPLLPFPISQATVDFIITHVDEKEKSAEVFAVAVSNQHIMEQVNLFVSAGVHPSVVTVDMVALYQLFKKFPTFAAQTAGKAIVLVDFNAHETRMAYVYDGRLKLIRTLAKGFLDQAKLIAKELNISTVQAVESIIRFGMEKNGDLKLERAIKNALDSYLKDFSFTLNSFTQLSQNQTNTIDTLLFTGEGAAIKGFTDYLTHALQIPCRQLDSNQLLSDPNIVIATPNKQVPLENFTSLATAFATLDEQPFNLLPRTVESSDTSILLKQLIVAITLGALLIGLLFFGSWWQLSSMRNEARESAQESIEALKNIGITEEETPGISPEDELEDLLGKAQTLVANKKKLVAEFLTSNKEYPLEYLLEFSKLDRDALGLYLKKLTITPDKIAMSGDVKTEPALRDLKQALSEISLFGPYSPAESLDKTSFQNVQIPIRRTKQQRREK